MDLDYVEILSDRVKKAMDKNAVSIKEVATAIKCDVSIVKNIVNNTLCYMPDVEILIRISKYLNCSLEWLFGLTEQYEFLEIE